MKYATPMLVAFTAAAFFQSGCGTTQTVDSSKSHITSDNHVILVGHGVPPSDFPRDKLVTFFQMEAGGGHHVGDDPHAHDQDEAHEHDEERAYAELERYMREWPRTPENDPYKFSVEAIAEQLSQQSGHEVLVAFNEFCDPTVEDTIEAAIADGADRIILLSIMLTPGGGHSEDDIPYSISKARRAHPEIEIVYAWPYDIELITDTLTTQVKLFESK